MSGDDPLAGDDVARLYNKRLMELARGADTPRRLDRPDATATAVSPVCGSEVTVDLALDGETIRDFGFEVEARALTRTVASVMAKVAPGKSRAELRDAAEAFRKMLKDGAAAPGGEWADLEILEPVRDYAARHNAVMLPFEAVEKAFRASEKQG